MKVFDAHCDTILRVIGEDADFAASQPLQVNLPAMAIGGVGAQVFACWSSTEQHPGRELEAALDMVAQVHRLVEAHHDRVALVLTAADLKACARAGRVAILIGLEGAVALNGDLGLGQLDTFFDLGLRVLTVAWSDNDFCGSVFGNGKGLSEAGRELMTQCEALGIVIDVSHASDQAFADILHHTKQPLIASHSNCRAVCPNPRNLTDAMIRQLSNRGGVLGINMGSGFLSPDFYDHQDQFHQRFFQQVNAEGVAFAEAMAVAKDAIAAIPRPSIDWIVNHIRHAIDVGGDDCVGFGSDFDGVESTPREVDSCADYTAIIDRLERGGLTAKQIEKVCWGNFERLISDVL